MSGKAAKVMVTEKQHAILHGLNMNTSGMERFVSSAIGMWSPDR